MLKLFGYISSIRNIKRWYHKRLVHKMEKESVLEAAIGYCEHWVKFGDTLSLQDRETRSTFVRSPNIGNLLLAVEQVSNAAETPKGNIKYLKTLPKWMSDDPTNLSLDSYITDEDGYYVEAEDFLMSIYTNLLAIRDNLALEFNDDYQQYYINKPKRLYTEVISVFKQFI